MLIAKHAKMCFALIVFINSSTAKSVKFIPARTVVLFVKVARRLAVAKKTARNLKVAKDVERNTVKNAMTRPNSVASAKDCFTTIAVPRMKSKRVQSAMLIFVKIVTISNGAMIVKNTFAESALRELTVKNAKSGFVILTSQLAIFVIYVELYVVNVL